MKEIKHSGQVWSKKLKIPILQPYGWPSIDDFNHSLINKEEFCNRAAQSKLDIQPNASRRESAKVFKNYE